MFHSESSGVCSRYLPPKRRRGLFARTTQPTRKQRLGTASLGRPKDPQLIHLVCQRRPLEAQASCRSTSASDNPIAFAERPQNLLSLGLFQCVSPAEGWIIQNFGQRHSQGW